MSWKIGAAAMLASGIAATTCAAAHAAPQEGTGDGTIPVSSAFSVVADSTDESSIRVIGGEKLTSTSQNPGAVLTSQQGYQHCSAIRIAPKWVISARHCIDDPASGRKFTIDTVWTNSVKAMEGDHAKVKATHIAPTADTILLELETAPPGPIASWSADPLQRRDTTEFYGWGYTAPFGRQLSDTLKRGEASFSSLRGGTYYGGENYTMRGKNSCSAGGDSGGPLFHDGAAVANLSWGMAGASAQFCVMGYVPFGQNAEWITSKTGVAPNSPTYTHMGD